MKKQLLTTTALAAAGMIAVSGTALAQKASKPTLTLGGWMEGVLSSATQKDNQRRQVGTGVVFDSEIHFNGAVTLDNGIRITGRVELEGQPGNYPGARGASRNVIDEAYITVTGSFGQFIIGGNDNAPFLEVTGYQGTWATNVGQNASLDPGDFSRVDGTGFQRENQTRLSLGDGDSEKITYFTPRVAGFRAGFTYMPSFAEGLQEGSQRHGFKDEAEHEGWAASLSFDRKFGGIGLGLAAGYATVKRQAGVNMLGDHDAGHPQGYALGARVDIQNFRVAAGYMREFNRTAAQSGGNHNLDRNREVFDVGARYSMGVNHFSVGWIHGRSENNKLIDGVDKTNYNNISYRRDLGPGVQYRLNLWRMQYRGGNQTPNFNATNYAVSTSVRLAF